MVMFIIPLLQLRIGCLLTTTEVKMLLIRIKFASSHSVQWCKLISFFHGHSSFNLFAMISHLPLCDIAYLLSNDVSTSKKSRTTLLCLFCAAYHICAYRHIWIIIYWHSFYLFPDSQQQPPRSPLQVKLQVSSFTDLLFSSFRPVLLLFINPITSFCLYHIVMSSYAFPLHCLRLFVSSFIICY